MVSGLPFHWRSARRMGWSANPQTNPRDSGSPEGTMAKGQMRSSKEKKKPKQDKNKQKSGAVPSPFMQSQSRPGTNSYGTKN